MAKMKTHRKLEQERLLVKHEYLLALIDLTNKAFMLQSQLIEFAGYLGYKDETAKSYLRELERAKIISREYHIKLQANIVILKKPAISFIRNIEYTSCPAPFKAQTSDVQIYRNMMKVEAILRLGKKIWAEQFRRSEEMNLAVFIRQQLDKYGSSLHLKQEDLANVYGKANNKDYYTATVVQSARAKSNIKNAKLTEREQSALEWYQLDLKHNQPYHLSQEIHALVNAKEEIASKIKKKEDLYTIYNLERYDVYVLHSSTKKITYAVLDVANSLTLDKLDDLYVILAKHSKHAGYPEFKITVHVQSRGRYEYLVDKIKLRATRKKQLVLNESGLIKTDEEKEGLICGKTTWVYMNLDKLVDTPTPVPATPVKEIKETEMVSAPARRIVLDEEF